MSDVVKNVPSIDEEKKEEALEKMEEVLVKKEDKKDGELNEEQFGTCEGPNSMYIKLKSSDDIEFIIKREYALQSGTIRAMLSGPGEFAEKETNEICFKSIPAYIMFEICKYLTFKARYMNATQDIPHFTIAPQIALELLMAANFLDC